MRRDACRSERTTSSAKGHAGGTVARLTAALAVLAFATLALGATSASAFVQVTTLDASRTPAGAMVPERMAVDESTGDVYVIDTASDAVERFNRYGRYLSQLKVPGAPTSSGTFAFDGTNDSIAVDNSSASTAGNVYVVGENNGEASLTAFRSDGTFLWQTGSPFPQPHKMSGVAVDPTNGDLWIADRFNGMVQVSPANGSSLGGVPVTDGGNFPAHMAFDTAGNLYGGSPLVKWTPPIADPPAATIDPGGSFDVATDSTNDDVYDEHRGFVAVYDRTGAADPNSPFGSSSQFRGIAVDGASDRIYLSNDDTHTAEVWAHVMPPMDALTVTANGSGRVEADHGEVSECAESSGTCTGSYIQGDVVILKAESTGGATFAGWSGPDAGSCGTSEECSVPMNASTANITATFTIPLPKYTLRVIKNGTGSGSVSCDAGACATEYEEGEEVTLAATPNPGSTFAGWSGGGCSGTGSCQVTMTADTTVTATFNLTDTDGDGIPDLNDACPHEAGTEANGCPPAPPASGGGGGGGSTGGPAPAPTPPPTPEPKETYGQCVKSANGSYKKALKAAQKKHGTARARAIHAAQKKKGKLVAECKKRFGKK